MCGARIRSSRTKCLVLVRWVESAKCISGVLGVRVNAPSCPGSYVYGDAHEQNVGAHFQINHRQTLPILTSNFRCYRLHTVHVTSPWVRALYRLVYGILKKGCSVNYKLVAGILSSSLI